MMSRDYRNEELQSERWSCGILMNISVASPSNRLFKTCITCLTRKTPISAGTQAFKPKNVEPPVLCLLSLRPKVQHSFDRLTMAILFRDRILKYEVLHCRYVRESIASAPGIGSISLGKLV